MDTSENLKRQTARLIYNDADQIGHWIGFTDLTKLHAGWIRSFLFAKEDQTLLAHRGSYKTSCLSLFLALHIVLRPNESVMVFRKTDSDVAEVVNQVKKILEKPELHKICRIVHDRDYKLVKENTAEIHTSLSESTRGASQLVGSGIFSSITGKHADLIITDDIVNLADRISTAERKKTKLQYMELQNIKNRGGRFINTGTPWHKEDAFSLMPNIRRYDCYSTGLIDRDELEDLRKSMSDSLFAANYELRHIADAEALFRDPQFTDERELIYDGFAHIDAAYGGSDYTAYTVMKEQADGRIIAFGKLWHKHIDDCLGEIAVYQDRYRAGSIAVETNADKGYLAKELRNRGFRPFTYPERTNKYIKISSYLRKAWPNIQWLEDTDPEYLNQILDYTEFAEHDDAPDSAASLIRRIEKKVQFNTFEGGL